MATAADANGIPRYDETDSGAQTTFSGLLNLGLGWVSAVLGGVLDGKTNTAWASVPSRNSGYADYSSNPAFTPVTYRRRNGDVQLRGTALVGGSAIASGAALFVLPAGFRPTHSHRFWGIVGSTPTIFEVRANGVVICVSQLGAGTIFSIDGFQFGAA